MGVPKDIQRRMDKTRDKRIKRQRKQVANATRNEIKGGKKSGCFLFGLVLCFAVLAACGPVGLPAPHPATTVAVPVPGGGA